MKAVAIIGAGPAGLVAAKTLLHSYPSHTFNVRVFEQSQTVGGLWPAHADTKNGLINPQMRTNLCRFTVCFSDLAWESVEGIHSPKNGNTFNERESHELLPPPYPKAWQVGHYLQQYARKYLPCDTISFNTKVLKADRLVSGDGIKWLLTTVDASMGRETQNAFDFLIVSTGLFARPDSIPCRVVGFQADTCTIPVIHSSCYRGISDIASNGEIPTFGNILVLGGSHSGGEIAASMALDISGQKDSFQAGASPLNIVHVTPNHMYGIPSFTQRGGDEIHFAPLDISLYDLSHRPEGPISFKVATMDAEKAHVLEAQIHSILEGPNPSEGASSNEPRASKATGSPYAIVSDTYLEFIRSGLIIPKIGRVVSLTKQPNNLLSASISTGSTNEEISDIKAVVYATGFETTKTLDFLSPQVKEQLGFAPQFPRLPLRLDAELLTTTPSLPDLALIGFSDGPYWGMLEMQARNAARRFTSDLCRASPMDGIADAVHAFRHLMETDKSSVPQNLFGDYVGFMEHAAEELRLERVDLDWGAKEGVVSPARYVDAGSNREEAEKTIAALQQTCRKTLETRAFVARAVFRSLQGAWSMKNAGSVNGDDDEPAAAAETMTFHPRRSGGGDYDYEYVCLERIGAGLEGKSDRYSVWRYDEGRDEIDILSTSVENSIKAMELEQRLEFQTSPPSTNKQTVCAVATLSGGTRAGQTYSFSFHGVHVTDFSVCCDGERKAFCR
ncbi:hypothetical protein MMC32_005632 [Xylographa parallela]|nr:hypothetical protein [Xylographa parallela]